MILNYFCDLPETFKSWQKYLAPRQRQEDPLEVFIKLFLHTISTRSKKIASEYCIFMFLLSNYKKENQICYNILLLCSSIIFHLTRQIRPSVHIAEEEKKIWREAHVTRIYILIRSYICTVGTNTTPSINYTCSKSYLQMGPLRT